MGLRRTCLAASLALALLACSSKREAASEEQSSSASPAPAPSAAAPPGEYRFVEAIEVDYGTPLPGVDLAAGRAWTLSRRQTLRRWDLDTGAPAGAFSGATHAPMLSRDGSHVVAWTEGEIRVFSSTSEEPLARWQARVKAVAISRDNQTLVGLAPSEADAGASTIRVWETATGRSLASWTVPRPPEGAASRPDLMRRYGQVELGAQGTRLLSWLPGWGQRVLLWALPEGERLAELDDVVTYSRSYVALERGADACALHRLEDGQQLMAARGRCVAFSEDESHLLTREGQTWRRYAIASKTLAGELELDGDATHHAFAPDGGALILGGSSIPTRAWDFAELSRPRLELGRSEDYSFSPDNELIWATHGDEHALHGYARDSAELLARLPGAQILGATEGALFTWSDRTLARWTLPSAEPAWQLRARVFAHEAQLSPSGERIAAWQKGELTLVRADDGARLSACEVAPEVDDLRWVDDEQVELLGESGYRALELPLINPRTCARSPGPRVLPAPAHRISTLDHELRSTPELDPRYLKLELELDPKLQARLIPSPSARWALLVHTKRADDLQTIELYEVASGERRWGAGALEHSVVAGQLVSFAWHPSGEALVVTSDEGAWVLEAESGRGQELEHTSDTYALAEAGFSADGRTLLLNDGGIRLLSYSL